ncbi:VOC family protein [Streptomyces sp. NPDC090108]|uniref:VOC family protein n=1 Tax=Streptomyces sp. NPDC090108 TaxID=3365947 RepID=UPI0037F9C6BE
MSTDTSSASAFRFVAVTFDCADPAELAGFYGELLELPVLFSTDDFALIGRKDSPGLGFTCIADHRPPTWPDPAHGKQAHLELGVDDLDLAEKRALALGAVRPDAQPDPDRWRVLVDPAGHPFCVTTLA